MFLRKLFKDLACVSAEAAAAGASCAMMKKSSIRSSGGRTSGQRTRSSRETPSEEAAALFLNAASMAPRRRFRAAFSSLNLRSFARAEECSASRGGGMQAKTRARKLCKDRSSASCHWRLK